LKAAFLFALGARSSSLREFTYRWEESVTQAEEVNANGATGEPTPVMADEPSPEPSAAVSVAASVPMEIETAVSRHDLAVVQFFNRLDRLFGDQIDARDREIAAKDRLISELERRAHQAEEHASLLKEYIANLAPGTDYRGAEQSAARKAGRRWWRFR
jgi:hypothetical protein